MVRFYGMLNILCGISGTDRQNPYSVVHFSYLPQMYLLLGLSESSGGRVSNHPQPSSSSSWLSMLTYHPGTKNRPAGGRSSET
jgi:hypothetical protein